MPPSPSSPAGFADARASGPGFHHRRKARASWAVRQGLHPDPVREAGDRLMGTRAHRDHPPFKNYTIFSDPRRPYQPILEDLYDVNQTLKEPSTASREP